MLFLPLQPRHNSHDQYYGLYPIHLIDPTPQCDRSFMSNLSNTFTHLSEIQLFTFCKDQYQQQMYLIFFLKSLVSLRLERKDPLLHKSVIIITIKSHLINYYLISWHQNFFNKVYLHFTIQLIILNFL